MNENELTTKERRAALEANGYEVSHIVDGDNSPYEWWRITAPDGWDYETDIRQTSGGWMPFQPSKPLEIEAIDQAYAHMQERKQLAALRKFVLSIARGKEVYVEDHITTTTNRKIAYTWSLTEKAQEIITKYNITAADESDSDG